MQHVHPCFPRGIDKRGWDEFGYAVPDAHNPLRVVDMPVMPAAEQQEIIEFGFPAI